MAMERNYNAAQWEFVDRNQTAAKMEFKDPVPTIVKSNFIYEFTYTYDRKNIG